MRADVLARLGRIARGEFVPVPGGTAGTHGTTRVFEPSAPGTRAGVLEHGGDNGALGRTRLGTSNDQKSPLFHVFHVFQVEHDEFAEAECVAIAVVDGRIPPAYADAWAAFQIRKPGHLSAADWYCAVDDAGRFLDQWADLALDFGWQPDDIFGRDGLARFCKGERVRALGPDNAVMKSGRIFRRSLMAIVRY